MRDEGRFDAFMHWIPHCLQLLARNELSTAHLNQFNWFNQQNLVWNERQDAKCCSSIRIACRCIYLLSSWMHSHRKGPFLSATFNVFDWLTGYYFATKRLHQSLVKWTFRSSCKSRQFKSYIVRYDILIVENNLDCISWIFIGFYDWKKISIGINCHYFK